MDALSSWFTWLNDYALAHDVNPKIFILLWLASHLPCWTGMILMGWAAAKRRKKIFFLGLSMFLVSYITPWLYPIFWGDDIPNSFRLAVTTFIVLSLAILVRKICRRKK